MKFCRNIRTQRAWLAMIIIALGACRNSSTTSLRQAERNIDSLDFTVEESPTWTGLFNRTSGWFGGDGIFAIPLNAKENVAPDESTETMFLFSDTMIGNITDGKLQSGSAMVNNSVAYLK